MSQGSDLKISYERELEAKDVDDVLAINQAHVPEVGDLTRAALVTLALQAEWVVTVRLDGAVVGFALLLVEGSAYGSPNYAWFSARYDRFIYVDRIALQPVARGRGVGRRIYGAASGFAVASDREALCAEVNTVPPNEASLAFHDKLGFERLSLERPKGDDTEVVMLALAITTA